jgi:hypothetical protein
MCVNLIEDEDFTKRKIVMSSFIVGTHRQLYGGDEFATLVEGVLVCELVCTRALAQSSEERVFIVDVQQTLA